jgi:hypothetical protein
MRGNFFYPWVNYQSNEEFFGQLTGILDIWFSGFGQRFSDQDLRFF